MRLVRHIADLPYGALAGGSVVTIGAYDGVHLGHRQLLNRVIRRAQKNQRPSIVMSFEPTPKEFFAASSPPARLMRFREKFEALADCGIDIFYCPRFDGAMRGIRADAFIRQILVHGLNARQIVVGDDFQFASRREGTIEHLIRASAALKFEVDQVPSVIVDGVRVSSTVIRDSLAVGDVQRASRLLGRPYRMSGKVVKGRQVGRGLGYATANVDIRRRQSAVLGIFAVRVSGLGEGTVDGVASLGTLPVDFLAHLRDEEKFASVDDLVAQMAVDAENARTVLAALAG